MDQRRVYRENWVSGIGGACYESVSPSRQIKRKQDLVGLKEPVGVDHHVNDR